MGKKETNLFSCYFFYFSTVTFFPVTFFPVTFFPTSPLLLSFLLLFFLLLFFRYFFSCYFLSYNRISRPLKRLMKKEKRLYYRKRHKPTRCNISKLKRVQQQVQKRFRHEYWRYINGILFPAENQDPENRKKTLWNYVKNCKKDSIVVASLRNCKTGELLTEAKDKAEVLNDQFQSVFSRCTPLALGQLCAQAARLLPQAMTPGLQRYPAMPDFTISTNGIKKMLATLKPHKAAGPDCIRPLILKELWDTIAPILQVIFTRSFKTGKLPSDWKKANVVPVFKKGSKQLPVNYRPVSLTCICCKLMEHIIVSQISRHLDDNNILNKNQHGFRRGLSCETQLVEFVHELHQGTIKGGQVNAIVMDFSKAFDKVAHNRLMHKLDKYGIQGNTAAWIKDFLSERTQQVVVDGEFSGQVPVTSGVPQGSVLGPVLFLLFINDITEGVTSDMRLFANDTIIYKTIRSRTDSDNLQKDLSRLEKWSKDWQMEFHPAKCNILHITRSKRPITSHTIYGHDLESLDTAKYLGVHLSTDLRWNRHVDATRQSASGVLKFLRRNLRVSSTSVKTRAYQMYVRPKLEYAGIVWDPHTKTNTDKIEMVQRQAAHWVLGRHHNTSSVTQMLQHLQWRSLEMRRIDTRLTFLYKLRNGLVGLDPSPYLQKTAGAVGRAHPHHYVQPRPENQIQGGSFFFRTVKQWNGLPGDAALAPSLDVFKHRVSQIHHLAWALTPRYPSLSLLSPSYWYSLY